MDYFDGLTLAALEVGGVVMLFVLVIIVVSSTAMLLLPFVMALRAAVRFAVRQIRKRGLA